MLALLFSVILAEAGIILSLVLKTPAKKAVIASFDKIKRGWGPVVVKAMACAVLAVLVSSLNSAFKIRRRAVRDGDVSPSDEVVMANHLLEASLMGFFLFLALLTDRLHHCMRELRLRRKSTMDAVRKNDGKFGGVEEILAREEQVGTFRDIVRQLQSELEDKSDELVSVQATIQAFKKQSDGMLLDYDTLISKNDLFRTLLHSLEQQE